MSLYIGSLMALCFLFVHVLLVCSWQFDTVHHWVCFNVVVGYCYVHVKSDFISYRKRSRFMSQTTGTHNTSMSMSKQKASHHQILGKKNALYKNVFTKKQGYLHISSRSGSWPRISHQWTSSSNAFTTSSFEDVSNCFRTASDPLVDRSRKSTVLLPWPRKTRIQ